MNHAEIISSQDTKRLSTVNRHWTNKGADLLIITVVALNAAQNEHTFTYNTITHSRNYNIREPDFFARLLFSMQKLELGGICVSLNLDSEEFLTKTESHFYVLLPFTVIISFQYSRIQYSRQASNVPWNITFKTPGLSFFYKTYVRRIVIIFANKQVTIRV